MKLGPLSWLHFTSHKGRTAMNLLSIAIAFLLFGLMSALSQIYDVEKSVNANSDERIITYNRLTLTKMLPQTYVKDIANVDGVLAVSRHNWFGGFYQEKKNDFSHYAVDPEAYSLIYPEYNIDPKELAAWTRTKNGIVVTPKLMQKFGWQVGDTVPIGSSIWPNEKGNVWTFVIVGVLDSQANGKIDNQVLMRFDMFEDANLYVKGQTDEIHVRVQPGADVNAVAQAIDALYIESALATRSRPENLFKKQFTMRYDLLRTVFSVILIAVFVTMLLIISNSIASSIRERFSEYSILRVLGFEQGSIYWAIFAQGLYLFVLGAAIGLSLAKLILVMVSPLMMNYPILDGVDVDALTLLQSLLMVVAFSFIATIVPAKKVANAKIVDVLRG